MYIIFFYYFILNVDRLFLAAFNLIKLVDYFTLTFIQRINETSNNISHIIDVFS